MDDNLELSKKEFEEKYVKPAARWLAHNVTCHPERLTDADKVVLVAMGYDIPDGPEFLCRGDCEATMAAVRRTAKAWEN